MRALPYEDGEPLMAHKADSKKTEVSHKHAKHAGKAKKDCQVKGCKGEYRAKGYCDTHYRMWKTGAFGKSRYEACSKEGCNKEMSKEGLCATHFGEKRGKAAPAGAAAPAAT
jgi:hypothetical protein